MVKIAIAGATSQLAREVIDHLATTEKHEITALIRKASSELPSLPGVEWVQTSYQDKSELIRLFKGIETVLCFFNVNLDANSETQKRVIDAAVEAGVKRYAPSEWAAGMNLAISLDVVPWYSNKIAVREHLEEINKDTKVLEYTLFQPGWFLNYLAHPHQTTKHVQTIPLLVDFEKATAFITEGILDYPMTYTAVGDIAKVVAGAIEYEGTWPVTGGIRGNQMSVGELLKIGEKIRGKPFEVDWLKVEDLKAGLLKTDKYPRVNLPSIPKDEVEAFSQMASIGILQSMARGTWTVTDEWNQLLPDIEFVQADALLESVWKK